MNWISWIIIGWVLVVLGGCSEYSTKPQTTILPTSNRSIDVVLHRSDVRFMDCSTGGVIQTFDSAGTLVDAKSFSGRALHCEVIQAGIQAGGMVGAASLIRPSKTNVNQENSNSNANTNLQSQKQGQGQNQTANGGQGGQGGQGGTGGNASSGSGNGGGGNPHGNNGGGNGSGDGTNPGTDHHHQNGDNN